MWTSLVSAQTYNALWKQAGTSHLTYNALWKQAGTSHLTYNALWKQVETALQNDHPQSAIAVLRKIQQKGAKEKSYGNYLAALIKEVNQQAEISEDSMTICKNRIRSQEQIWQKEGNGVMAVLCKVAMGGSSGGSVSMSKRIWRNKAFIDSLLASPDAKAYTKADAAAAWVPFIDKESDSRYFHNDLLHIIGMAAGEYDALYRYYSSTNDSTAACIAAALMLEHLSGGKTSLAKADSLIAVYGNQPECGAIAKRRLALMTNVSADEKVRWIDASLKSWPQWKENNEMRNIRQTLTQPSFTASLTTGRVNTMMPIEIVLSNVRNISGVQVLLTSDKGQRREFTLAMPQHSECAIMKDTLRIGRLPLGRWTITITDSEGKIKSEKQTLYVTDLRVIQQAMPHNMKRYVVVNDITGQPVKGATLIIKKNAEDKEGKSFTVDDNGEYEYASEKQNNIVSAISGEDTAMPEFTAWSYYNYSKPKESQKHLIIYTDRSIYRPGQTVHVAVIRQDVLDGVKSQVTAGDTVKLTLSDAEYNKIDERTVITDEYGTASVDFILPTEGRTGNCNIQGSGKANAYTSLRVEEYKRPTFEVTLSEPSESYKAGDTITIIGTARTYSGIAVANARVAYSVRRTHAWWWHRGVPESLLSDTVYTDADGKFSVRMPMSLGYSSTDSNGAKRAFVGSLFYNIVAEATVMDNGGESHSASLSLPLSNREAYISCDLKDKILADTTITLRVTRRSASGKLIDGDVTMTLDGKAIESAKANQDYALPRKVVSGEHRLVMVCGDDTLTRTFVLFRKSDKAPVADTKDWFYISGNEFPVRSAKGKKQSDVWMQVGTLEGNVHVVYAIYSASQVLEKGTMTLDGNNLTRTFPYKTEYGDGITISLAWVKDGKMYSHAASIRQPLESNKLHLEWTTFRNKLVPGQTETWKLRIQGGTSQKKDTGIQMMSVLYDKSLDALKEHDWHLTDYRNVSVPMTNWNTDYSSSIWWQGKAEKKNLPETGMKFSSVAYDCCFNPYEAQICYLTAPRMLLTKNGHSKSTSVVGYKADDVVACMDIAPVNDTNIDMGLRSDFSETAFFMPRLLTDNDGIATLTFTLPESVTTWKFMALAHDKEMRFGTLIDEAVAQKQLMLQAKMPRFLRVGDKGKITCNVSNLTEVQKNVTVTMTVMNAKSESVVYSDTKTMDINADSTSPVTFNVSTDTTMTDGLICRFMARGGDFSDGEQHLLPVLTDVEEKIDTTSFVVEPRKMILESLPQLAVPESKNAVTLSNAIYANVMSAYLKAATGSATNLAANDNVVVQLLALQNADGGFSWYSGMESSMHITASVVKTLVRMNKISSTSTSLGTSVQSNTEQMLARAFSYLEKEMTKEMEYQKEHKQNYLSSTALDWLYALTETRLCGGARENNVKVCAAEKFFRNMLYSQTVKDNMQTKAVAGIVLNNNKEQKKAREFATSIKQHTVYRPDMGRYFDSYRAEYSWCDYKIPTQTMCIEALDDITPKDTTTITQMQKWLVQSKRTQRWDNAINAVNAVYALSLNKAQKPFMAAYKVNPEDYKNIIKVSRSLNGTSDLKSSVKIGDRVKVTITIVADRDYDFVTVTDNRAACMEPVNQTSGYHWCRSGNGYYQETRDQKTVYHFDQLRKGTHTIETEYYIDRAGNYTYGPTTAVCEYAQEFRGSADGTNIETR